MMNARLPLLVLLLAAAAPVRAAGLTDFETSLESALQQSDGDSYKKMRAECDALKADEAKRLECVRKHLSAFTQAYEARVKDAKIEPKKGLVGNLDDFEKMMIGQVALSDPGFKAKWQADQQAAAKDAKEVPGLVAGYRAAITGLTGGYRSKPAESTRSSMTAGLTGAKKQLEKVNTNPEAIIDGNTRKPSGVAVDGSGDKDKDKKGKKGGKDDPNAQVNAESKTPNPDETKVTVPPTGDLTATPAEKPADPNRWNNTIAGTKGALYGALLGFIFGGPMGMLVFGMVGFAAMYGISKMNNS